MAGLSAVPPRVSPRWLYDRRGSELFERICDLPEYYPTRTELGILDRHGPEIARAMGPHAVLVDFGAGSLRKARCLVTHLVEPAGYCPIDVSAQFLAEHAARWRRECRVHVAPVVADFTAEFDLPAAVHGSRCVGFFPGSSIGNLEPGEARDWLRRVRARLPGGLLVGVDLIKNPDVLRSAYDDAAGVTAAFNLNLWARANREAGADFVLDQWRHLALYDDALHRIEMHLVSRCRQTVRIAERAFRFEAGHRVHTESSYKYSVQGFQALAVSAGWRPADVWVDRGRLFAVHWLEPGEGEDPA
jgi:dimethylhistidine N-methyltransferase